MASASSHTVDDTQDEHENVAHCPRPAAGFQPWLKKTLSLNRNVWLGATVLLLLSLGTSILFAPSLRSIENTICKRYYSEHDPRKHLGGAPIPEKDCKIQPIQSALALVLTVVTVGTNLIGEYLPIYSINSNLSRNRACCPSSTWRTC